MTIVTLATMLILVLLLGPSEGVIWTVERFDDAWIQGGLESVQDYLDADGRKALARVAEGQGWDGKLPELQDRSIQDARVQVRYETDQGPLIATWSLRQEEWCVTDIRVPSSTGEETDPPVDRD